MPRRLALVAAAVAALAFLAWNVDRHWFLLDDAYISFRYVRNLVDGHGLVFNRGEWVEGYTNFLWVLELAGLWAGAGLPPDVVAPWLGVLATMLCVPLIVALGAGLRERPGRAEIAALSLVLWATNRSVAVWATSGLETRQFTLLVLLGWWTASLGIERRRLTVVASLAFALAELTRPEALLVGPVVLGTAWLVRARRHGPDARAFAAAVVPFVAIVAAHLLWRHATYGDWLPNTYYAKTARPWWDMGALYLGYAALEQALYLLIPLGIAGTVARTRAGDPTLLLGWAYVVPMMVHLARLGGDHFELRVFDELWPVFDVAAAEGLVALARRVGRGRPAVTWATGAGATAVVLVYALALPLAHDAATLGMNRAQAKALKLELTPKTSPVLFTIPGMPWIVRGHNLASRTLISRFIGNRHISHATFCDEQLEAYGAFERYAGTGFLPPDATTSRVSIGVIGWALPDLRIVDEKGLADAVIARNPIDEPNSARMMAHDREPPVGYLAEQGVNLYVWAARSTDAKALATARYAVQVGDDLWMAFDSPDPDWVERAFGGRAVHREHDALLDALAGLVVPPPPPPQPPPGDVLEIDDRAWRVVRWLGRFDDGTDGWVTAGTAFEGAAAGKRRQAVGGLLDTERAGGKGAKGVGVAASPSFVATAGQALAFRIAGSDRPGTGLYLVGDGREALGDWHGRRDAVLRPVVVPLDAVVGRTVHLELRDASNLGGGSTAIDEVAVVEPEP
jgi:arabinofuranosyltransferase